MNPTPPPVVTASPFAPVSSLTRQNDPLRFSLGSWRHWLIIGSVVVLLSTAIVATALAPTDPAEGAGYTLGANLGAMFCVLLAPLVVLGVALAVKQVKARSALFTVGASLLAGLSLLYIPTTALATFGKASTAAKVRYTAALSESEAISAAVFKEASDLNSEFMSKGGVAPKTLDKLAAIDERLSILRAMRAANTTTLARLDTLQADIEAVFDKHSVSDSVRAEFWRGYNRGSGGIPTLRAIRVLDKKLIDEMVRYVSILRDSFGHWEFNEEGLIVFESEDALAEFNASAERIQALGAEQTALVASIKGAGAAPAR
ncbi:MAG: hypothetical protein Q8L55_11055 [Phycisphaerales bacterium]|nr:hypothetical protein [Phycisphaerales bacterium]